MKKLKALIEKRNANLEAMGLSTVLSIAQAAWDRVN